MYTFAKESEAYAKEIVAKLSNAKSWRSVWNLDPITKPKSNEEQNLVSQGSSFANTPALAATPIDVDTPEWNNNTPQSTSSSVHGKRLLSSQSEEYEPLPKRIKTDHSEEPSLDNKNSSCDNIFPNILRELAYRVRESWISEQKSQECDLNELFLCSPDVIDNVFYILNLSTLPEKSFATACKDLVSILPTVSYSISVRFIKDAILSRLTSMEHSGSRLLLTTLTDLTTHFPNQVCQAVLVPCITNANLGNVQAELLTKLLKNCLLQEQQILNLLKSAMTDMFNMNDSLITLYHTILIHSKGCLDCAALRHVLMLLSHNAPNQSKNLKYGKLVMEVVRMYGKQIKGSDFGLLNHIIECHKSFLHKSLKSALQKLKS